MDPTRNLAWVPSFLLAVALGAGCAHMGAEARELSRELLVQTVEYEQQLSGSSRALRAYLEGRVIDLEEDLSASQRKRLRSVIREAAEDATEAALRKGFTASGLRGFLRRTVAKRRAAEKDATQQLATMRTELQALSKDLKVQEQRLKNLRVKLEKLQSERSTVGQLRDVKELIEPAIDKALSES